MRLSSSRMVRSFWDWERLSPRSGSKYVASRWVKTCGAGLQEGIGVDVQGDSDFLTVVEVGDFLGARIGHQAGGG